MTEEKLPPALYERHRETFVPSELTRGPWHPAAQHGGPPAALLSQATARFEGGNEMFVARVTIELLKPVPLIPLSVGLRMARPGRKVQLVEAVLAAGGIEVARALALRIRRMAVDLPEPDGREETPPPPSSDSASLPSWGSACDDTIAYHTHGVDHRLVRGTFDELGPATDWIRLRKPLIAGEETTAVARVAAAGDFGNGISAVLSRLQGYSFINPDLTLYLYRHPAGEWVCLEATTGVQPHGIGLAESKLYDEAGPIGRSLQSLIIERT